MPNSPAMMTENNTEIRANISSFFSEIFRAKVCLIKSCETAVEITNNKPAAYTKQYYFSEPIQVSRHVKKASFLKSFPVIR